MDIHQEQEEMTNVRASTHLRSLQDEISPQDDQLLKEAVSETHAIREEHHVILDNDDNKTATAEALVHKRGSKSAVKRTTDSLTRCGTRVGKTPAMDIFVFILLGVFCAYLYFVSDPYKRGFWTGDTSIRYPFRPLTVSVAFVIVVSYVIPMLIIIFTERMLLRVHPGEHLKKFSFVTLANLLVNLFFKFTTGRLRPHFLTLCKVKGLEDRGINEFLADYTCTEETSDARQSFYSGHAAISMCAATYIIIYIQEKFPRSLTKSFFQIIIMLIGFYPGVTQINNFHHHWSDVATGYAAGVTFALLGYFFV